MIVTWYTETLTHKYFLCIQWFAIQFTKFGSNRTRELVYSLSSKFSTLGSVLPILDAGWLDGPLGLVEDLRWGGGWLGIWAEVEAGGGYLKFEDNLNRKYHTILSSVWKVFIPYWSSRSSLAWTFVKASADPQSLPNSTLIIPKPKA